MLVIRLPHSSPSVGSPSSSSRINRSGGVIRHSSYCTCLKMPPDQSFSSQTVQILTQRTASAMSEPDHLGCPFRDSINLDAYLKHLDDQYQNLPFSATHDINYRERVGRVETKRLCQDDQGCLLCDTIAGLEWTGAAVDVHVGDSSILFERYEREPSHFFAELWFTPATSPEQGRLESDHEESLLVWLPDHYCTVPLRPSMPSVQFDASKARRWIELCDRFHGGNNKCETPADFTPKRLIDCKKRAVVIPPDQVIDYVALSYIWGQAATFELPSPVVVNEKLGPLPKTIEDAMTVARALYYDYIWVDMICIDQKDEADKHDQIRRMDQVYRHAALTIVVAAGDHCNSGIPGVSQTSRQTQHTAKLGHCTVADPSALFDDASGACWSERAWTFQEGLLSGRKLILGDRQMSFECAESLFFEGLGNFECVQSESDMDHFEPCKDYINQVTLLTGQGTLGHDSASNGKAAWAVLGKLTGEYSSRVHSYESDIFSAFRAISDTFARQQPRILMLCGIPFIDDGTEATLNVSLLNGMAWTRHLILDYTLRDKFPHRSWMRIRTKVHWQDYHRPTRATITSITTRDGRVFPLAQLSRWWLLSDNGTCLGPLLPRTITMSAPKFRSSFWETHGSQMQAERNGRLGRYEYHIDNARLIIGHTSLDDQQFSARKGSLQRLKSGLDVVMLITQRNMLILEAGQGGEARRVGMEDFMVLPRHGSPVLSLWQPGGFLREWTEMVEVHLV